MSVIEVHGIKKKYSLFQRKTDKLKEAFSITGKKYHEEFWALKGIDFSVERGECVGIIGLNGSGKSTLLKILTDVIPPTEGSVTIKGRVSALLELGGGFNPEYTGMENIYLNTMLLGFSREQTNEKLNEILEFADIGEFIHQPVKLYSSGMFVRLAFAIAVSVEPDILIVDEALSVGDVFFQQKCYKKMKEIMKHATVIIVSHDMGAITKLCSRCMVMNAGQIIYDGNTKDAMTEYFKLRQGENPFLSYMDEEPQEQENPIEEPIRREIVFRTPDDSILSGKMNAVIEQYYYEIERVPFQEECARGMKMEIRLRIRSCRRMDHLIVGYQVYDKYGNEVFGENTATSGYTNEYLDEGMNEVIFHFTWPELRDGVYFITLGIGEGDDILSQTEQCWMNQVIHIYYTNYGKVIYGMFNQPLESFEVYGHAGSGKKMDLS